MSTSPTASTLPAAHKAPGPTFLPLILFLFIGSGCSALIYEIVWFQLLEFSIGASAISIGVLLATFMGGLCLGSLLFSRLVSPRHHPLLVYAFLELGIGILGILLTLGMPAFEGLYATIAHGSPSIVLRALLSALFLLPPTMLMGATLPAISRWIETTPRGLAWLGFFYGGNTLGAVIGCLLGGFYLLRLTDMYTTTFVAAGINLLVAVVGIILSRMTAHGPASSDMSSSPSDGTAKSPGTPPAIAPEGAALIHQAHAISRNLIYLTIALSGMTALGAEVIWTRLLSLLLGGTTYTFSIILAVFLAGLGIGSSVGAMLTRNAVNPRMALAWCQVLLGVCIGWTAYCVTNGLPNWPINPAISLNATFRFELDLARCCWAILPPTMLWGASFPLALAALAGGIAKQDAAKTVGRVYAANTVGAILGALFFSLVAVKAWGTQGSENILISLAGIAAIATAISAALASLSLLAPARAATGLKEPASPSGTFAGALAALIATLFLAGGTIFLLQTYGLSEVPWKLVAYGRNMSSINWGSPAYNTSHLEFMGEGRTSSVAVTTTGPQDFRFHVAGKVEASTLPEDMRLQLMLGHFPAMFHPAPKKVLVVGCGAGVTAGSFILHPTEKIVICEIEPLVPEVVANYFKQENNGVVTRLPNGKFLDDRVQIVYDDARHYILTTDEKFDIITSDPIHPWVKGAACLYTREYFDLVKKHLNPGGLVTQWVPLYESNTAVVKSEIKTFFEAFPNGTVWSNDRGGEGYDVVLMGGDQPLKIDAPALQKRMGGLLGALLAKVQFKDAGDILKTYAGSADDLKAWTADGQTNHDSNLRLQYLAGEALNDVQADDILNEIVKYRTFPDNMLRATPDQRKILETAWSPRSPAIAPPK